MIESKKTERNKQNKSSRVEKKVGRRGTKTREREHEEADKLD